MSSPSTDRGAWIKRWQEKDADAFDARSAESGRLVALRRLADLAVTRVSAPALRTLEVGCGTGLFAKTIGARHVIGLDVSIPMLCLARLRMDRVCQQDLFRLAIRPLSVDNVVCAFVLDDYPPAEKRAFMRSALGVLRPEGRFFLTAYSPADQHMSARAAESELSLYLEEMPAYIGYLDEAGFTVEHAELIRTTGRFEESDGDDLDRQFLLLEARL